jgi:hypothetical protein
MNFRRYEMSLEEMVRAAFKNFRRYDTPANDFKVIGIAKGAITRYEVGSIIKQLALEGQLIYAPKVAEALAAAKEQHPHYDFNAKTFSERILDHAEHIRFDITSATDLTDVCSWLISQPEERIQLSAYGREAQQHQAEAKQIAERRLQLLTSILQGRKTTYPKWDPKEGKIMYIDAYSLEKREGEDDNAHLSRLAHIEREVTDLRRQQNGTRGDQRQDLRQIADSNKEHRIYRPGDTDSLDTDAVPTKWGDDYKSPIAGLVDARSYSKNEKVVVGTGTAAATADPFISQTSGREITKSEAYAFAKNDLKTFRQLMKADYRRLNRILKGE